MRADPGVRRTEQLENGCWTADAHSLFGLLGVVVAGYGSKGYKALVGASCRARLTARLRRTATPESPGEGVTTTETRGASQTIDNALQLIIEAIEANPPGAGAGVEVTFYLPSGTVVGNLEPCWYFDQKLLHYLQTIGIDHNHPTPNEGTCGKHQFVHLSKVTYQPSGGDVYQHDQLRVRLADVHSWAFGRGHDSVKEVRW